MIVCLCEDLNDRDIRATIERGATTVREVKRACGAGTQCGSCVQDIREILAEAGYRPRRRPMPLAAK